MAPRRSEPSDAVETPTVLVVAREGGARRALTSRLVPAFRVREVAPEALGNPAPLVDAAAAVAVLEAAPVELEALGTLRAGRALVLVASGQDEASLEIALETLRPAALLPYDAPGAALRLAVQRALAAGPPARGAREKHRCATTLLGVSAAIRSVTEQIRQIAPTRLPVLILGETGTGKELVARAVHERSDRARGRFVAVNCGAFPESLLEAELFGFVRGAFTGAQRDRVGLFEEASGGTLFLDEIGDTSLALQVKLLRAIEAQVIRPIGANEERSVDVRIVSATHRDIETAAKAGEFRQDLLYRLNGATIHVPPLRRRRVDIPFLAQHFAEEFGTAHARRILLDEGFLEALSRRDFPGNVRELRNAVERALALAEPDGPVTAAHLESAAGGPLAPPPPRTGTLRERVQQLEIEAISEALARFEGNITHAAAELGLSRLGLRQKMRRLGLEKQPR